MSGKREIIRQHQRGHKPICRQASDSSVVSRPPAIKVAMRMLQDDELMSSVDGIIIKCLDLEHHPENAEKYAVALSCRVESTDTKMAVERIQYYIKGQEPPPLPEKLPKLFQIGKVVLIPNDAVPDGLDELSEKLRKLWNGQGLLKPEGEGIVVRAFWVDEQIAPAVCFCPRPVSQEMIDEVAGWMKPKVDGSGPSNEPMTTEGLIKLFDIRALCEPDYKKKLTIMAPTG
ncbi:hypothetical protein GSI_06685 [Ganoderma sinense ZZ0214-1]|uniref:Uncharacterized protein n=1 Tax=Ganoderma sinense ZZ0214-1 TaxID=1077348 RepID=A0A2G8SE05_9APHY|nr:hypothetical protein GSI_06685 [Ganoderma sinense ZZ0214-1]